MSKVLCAAIAATVAAWTSVGRAEIVSYYVGVDNLSTIASGTYAGLPNPNAGKLTFLYAHPNTDVPASSHYHSKAVTVYTGPNLGVSTATMTSASNYLPEGTNPPLAMLAGSGFYAGKLAVNPSADPLDPNYHASHVTVGNTQELAAYAAGTPEAYMFNSSSGRWSGAFNAADVHLELVSLTPGLHVGDSDTFDVLASAGSDLHLGEGDESFRFSPVFWTAADALPGTYEAAFRLVDESGTYAPSGTFRFVTQVVPEPASLGVISAVATIALRRRRRGVRADLQAS